MDYTTLGIFIIVYAGMILGEFPGLALDRTGVALLGAMAILATGRLTPDEAWRAIDVPTMGLLFGLMIVSAQFQLSGFYGAVTRRLSAAAVSPQKLLAWVVIVAGVLSALLANDIVCLVITPMLIEGCMRRGLNPIPYALGLACAANVGSAATLIGNPQNMLIGQSLHLSFGGYLAQAALPSVLGLIIVWVVVSAQFRGRWELVHAHRIEQGEAALKEPRDATHVEPMYSPLFNSGQTTKGAVVLALLIAGFLAAPWPREVMALAAAGVLLVSRKLASRALLTLVDFQLLLLFFGLFVINNALAKSGMLAQAMDGISHAGLPLNHVPWLMSAAVVLSNIVSNVPSVMLLLPIAKTAASTTQAGTALALGSTLAGNLFIVGTIANIIVIDAARRRDVHIGWKTHARIGVPVTVLTLAVASVWILMRP